MPGWGSSLPLARCRGWCRGFFRLSAVGETPRIMTMAGVTCSVAIFVGFGLCCSDPLASTEPLTSGVGAVLARSCWPGWRRLRSSAGCPPILRRGDVLEPPSARTWRCAWTRVTPALESQSSAWANYRIRLRIDTRYPSTREGMRRVNRLATAARHSTGREALRLWVSA